uniref:Uncharacterized protein MANES_05G161500 n=1 Tax=Rhizophora mucronata TaxID=61149 RepID=A0A2P2KKM7_RHIMU
MLRCWFQVKTEPTPMAQPQSCRIGEDVSRLLPCTCCCGCLSGLDQTNGYDVFAEERMIRSAVVVKGNKGMVGTLAANAGVVRLRVVVDTDSFGSGTPVEFSGLSLSPSISLVSSSLTLMSQNRMSGSNS